LQSFLKVRRRAAEEFASSREDAWEKVSGVIYETQNIASAGSKIGLAGRRITLDYWVSDVWIAVGRFMSCRA